MVKGKKRIGWHTVVAQIATERGIDIGDARRLYKSGVRPGETAILADAQPAIAGGKSLSAAVSAAEGFIGACNAANVDPKKVFDFVTKTGE